MKRRPRPISHTIDEAYIRFVFRLTRGDKVEILDSLEGKILSNDSDSPILNDGTSLPQFENSINEALYRLEVDEQTKGARSWSITKRKVKDNWLVPKPSIPAEVTVALEFISVPLSSISIVAADAITDDVAQHCIPLTFEKWQAVVGNALISHVNDNLPEGVLWSQVGRIKKRSDAAPAMG
ncbi:MAG: hypothetical protein H8E66_02390 [Planctomycetes bacterium]|nr:hypothetical protein [Planctomycetota bacterium]